MKKRDEKVDLKQLSYDELLLKADSLRKDLFNVRLNAITAHVKDYSQFKKLRKEIARVLTCLRSKESAAL
jgi:ribosomal protein L29